MPDELDLTDAPLAVPLRPSEIRALHAFVRGVTLNLRGFPTNAEWSELLLLRRIREALDSALAEAGLPGLEAPGGELNDGKSTG